MKSLNGLGNEIEVEVSPFFKPQVGDYITHNGKIYRAFSSSGAGKNYRISFERTDGDKITFNGLTEELKNLRKIISPTGYINF